MAELRDPRCQKLLAMSDFRTLAVVHERWPDLIPEWDAMQVMNAVMFEPARWKEWASVVPIWAELARLPDPVAQEYCALLSLTRVQLAFAYNFGVRGPIGRMLDMGAYNGAVGIALANRFPDATVYLRDQQASCLSFMQRTIKQFANTPAQLVPEIGGVDEPPLPTELDCVWAAEILEHNWDWRGFLEKLERACKPGATMCVTTPWGPWEEARADIVHGHTAQWEPDDIRGVFGERPGFVLGRIGESDEKGTNIFWWQVTHEPFPPFPIDAKLKRWGFDA